MTAQFDTFIELLCEHHGLAGGKAQFAGCILLQGTRSKRRRRLALALALFHLVHQKFLLLEISHQCFRCLLIVQVKFFPIHMGKLSLKHRGLVLAQFHAHRPVFHGLKGLNFLFPVADKLDRYGLHAACRKPLAHLAPEQRRKLVAHNAVEHTAGLLGIHLVDIDATRMLYRLLNGRFRDFIEDNAAVLLRV